MTAIKMRLWAGMRGWLLAPGRRRATLAAHALWRSLRDGAGRRAARGAQAGDLGSLLTAMGALEAAGRTAPLIAGEAVAERMLTPEGRAALLPAAMAAQGRHPDSAYLTHLVTLSQAMGGAYRLAAADLAARLAHPPAAGELGHRRFTILRDSWRMVDVAAREAMDWTETPGAAAPGGVHDADPQGPAPDAGATGFREDLLQSRQREAYLAACDGSLAAAETTAARLAALNEMLRPSLRQTPSYTASYTQAWSRFDALAAEWAALIDTPLSSAGAETGIRDLCALLALARRLGRADTAARTRARLIALAQDPGLGAVLWPVPAALAEDPAETQAAARAMAAIRARHAPLTGGEVKAFFRWAELAGDHAGADAVFDALPERLRRAAGLLPYVQMLQGRGDFDGAGALLAAIHAQMMANPLRVSAFFNRSLIRRRGEVAFLQRTAAILGAVPQPARPRGLILIAARNVDHLRRYPLMMLAEARRRGWAVIPLVAGLLPPAPTGDPAIDRLDGCLTPQGRLQPGLDLPPAPPMRLDLWQGVLDLGGLDLGHCLWEEAAISRRRHRIDWSCPELAAHLTRLADWTAAMARPLAAARSLTAERGLRLATMSLSNARLPDRLFHADAAAHDDPERYFSLLAANGYQNYFDNFATNLSERMVLRNMTRAPEVRSASFPRPALFARFAETRQAEAPALLTHHLGMTQVARSTGGQPSSEGRAALDRIAAARAAGDRVICAFGRVLSDSAVPRNGGPAHADVADWIGHTVSVLANRPGTLLVIKPHPHEANDLIASFPTETFADLLPAPLPDNVLLLGHRWCDIADLAGGLAGGIDLGLVYSGTTAVELGMLGIPCILGGHFAPVDYPIGHAVPRDRAHYAAMLTGAAPVEVAPDLAHRAALWIEYMRLPDFTLPYRYHARPITNRVLYPPWWIEEDLHRDGGRDPVVALMCDRALDDAPEPGG